MFFFQWRGTYQTAAQKPLVVPLVSLHVRAVSGVFYFSEMTADLCFPTLPVQLVFNKKTDPYGSGCVF